ncbi:MAG: DUF6134 family protein [Pseudomonadota bacterium]
MYRRTLLLGAAAGVFCPVGLTAAAADGTASRVFRILRGGKDIGRHMLTARRTADTLEITIEIAIRVRFLGITAYRYEMTNREVWQDGALLTLDSETNDDGTDDRLTIRREGDALAVDGLRYSGRQPLQAVTTTYYAPAFLERRPWLSSQSGEPLQVSSAPIAGEPGAVQLSGEIDSVLIYDDRGEWVGCRFDASGELATYEVIEETGAIAAMWRAEAQA